MPATRRRGGKTAATRSTQPTLSFGPLATDILEKATETDLSEAEKTPVSATEPSKPHVAELAVRQQARQEIKQPLSAEDKRAIKITKKELQQYWNQLESKSRGPRVHQDGLSVDEKILRHFDLSSQFGPCIGIARLKRWRRAQSLDLNPPMEVLSVLLAQEDTKGQRAYMDELLS
ncbi:hypothetical protein AOCH_004967 [Aspergillus ochraceoroseus]|uniref:DNA polymerase delta subunit 4 n=1 Tax=Aspergillus ochraceoroseus TaxID=138278 RepID=A0A0F8WNI7_9EURO|nr:hypothetical protein AOCH_004967 [Aspergillus ochraceoroseus]